MIRNNPPFNGKRYILNTNTCEVHDLEREQTECRINEINKEHIYSCDSYSEAELHSVMLLQRKSNGCAYCMPEKNEG